MSNVNSTLDNGVDKAEPQIGDTMVDGTIYAGMSPDTNMPMYVTKRDERGPSRWEAAMKYATWQDSHGHKDWRLPTKAELEVLYQNRHKGTLNGTFNENASTISSCYWSSTKTPYHASIAWVVAFGDGDEGCPARSWKDGHASVRYVRSEPRPPT